MSTRCNRKGRGGHRELYGTHVWPEAESPTRIPRSQEVCTFWGGLRIKLMSTSLYLSPLHEVRDRDDLRGVPAEMPAGRAVQADNGATGAVALAHDCAVVG